MSGLSGCCLVIWNSCQCGLRNVMSLATLRIPHDLEESLKLSGPSRKARGLQDPKCLEKGQRESAKRHVTCLDQLFLARPGPGTLAPGAFSHTSGLKKTRPFRFLLLDSNLGLVHLQFLPFRWSFTCQDVAVNARNRAENNKHPK